MTEPAPRDRIAAVISEAVGGWNKDTAAITNVAEAILRAFPVLAAEPTTAPRKDTGDVLDAVVRYAESWRSEGGEVFGPALMLDVVSIAREALAALAPEPAETDEWQEGLVSWEYVKDDAAADMQNHPLSIDLLKAWYVAGFENGAQTPPPAVSPDEPKPLDPERWIFENDCGEPRYAESRESAERLAKKFNGKAYPESHYPKDGN